MSTVKPDIPHLTQEKLGDKDKTILAGFVEWLAGATFRKKKTTDDFELCVDSELPEKWKLLEDMDLVKKVQ